MAHQEASNSASVDNAMNRRCFLESSGLGLGRIALASLLTGASSRVGYATEVATVTGSARPPHFAPRAKSVIYLFMAGGPSHLDLFDYKPALARFEGKSIPPEIIGGQRYAFIRSDAAALGPRFKFNRHGKSGVELAEVLPQLGEVVDDVCFIRSMHTDQFNHAPAQIFLNTGFSQPGRPSMGSWVTYGLGAETSDLPAFVVMSTGAGISGGAANWSSGFLPTVYSGVRFRNQGDPILDVTSPAGVDSRLQRETLDLVSQLNHKRLDALGDPEIATRIAAYEMAYRLQTSAPELMNVREEGQATLDLYGADPDKPTFARACLLARRMVERGVRFVNIYNEGWDAHSDLAGNHKKNCGDTDRAAAALVKDLKQRGLLDETLVVFAGEFGRTPLGENRGGSTNITGRDHHPFAFSLWMAGGGVKGGLTYGATDDIGWSITENPVHINDFHATMLHLFGIDHLKLTHRHQGLDARLTGVAGKVIKEWVA